MSLSMISADETDQVQTGPLPVTEPNSSVTSRVLKADSKVLEELVESYDLTEGKPGASSADAWDMGPWDEGHWANRR